MALSLLQQSVRKTKRSIAFGCRSYLVRTNRYRPLYTINCGLYTVVEKLVKFHFCGLPGVVSTYLAHGQANGELFPGLSDFDLVLVWDPEINPSLLPHLRRVWNRVRQLLPIRDLSVMTEQDFLSWQRFGAGMDPLDELPHWIHLSGRDLRTNDRLDLSHPQAENDRQRYAFASYHRLLRCALKDESNLHFLTISLRRQIYKSFCAAVLPLERENLIIAAQSERLRRWGESRNSPLAQRLLALRENRFHRGEVSRLCFEAAACAYRELDAASKKSTSLSVLQTTLVARPQPLFNEQEITARASRLAAELTRHHADRFSAIVIVGSGSARGYALQIVLRDGLIESELIETLRHIHEIFRLFDDPWFNEHYPGGVPIVLSRAMWQRTLELWPFYAHYWRLHPITLFGEGLTFEPQVSREQPSTEASVPRTLEGERAALSRYYRQLCLEASRPAFFDFITLHLPRFIVTNEGRYPTTCDEAVSELEQGDSRLALFSRQVLEQYRKHDIDALLFNLPLSLITEKSGLIEAVLTPSAEGALQ